GKPFPTPCGKPGERAAAPGPWIRECRTKKPAPGCPDAGVVVRGNDVKPFPYELRAALEVELEPDLQHARRDDFLDAAEIGGRELRRQVARHERVECRLRGETLRRRASAVL